MRTRGLRLLNRVLFGITALPYDWLSGRTLWREHCRELVHELPDSSRKRTVLDLGCGPGVSAIELLNAGQSRAVAVDLSAPMLSRARRHRDEHKLGDRLLLVRADAAALPFKDGAFDAITAHSLLYLLPDRATALREARRVLRPGGVLVALEPAPGRHTREVLSVIRQRPSFALTALLWRLVSRAAGRLTPEQLRSSLTQAGFASPQIHAALAGLGQLARASTPA